MPRASLPRMFLLTLAMVLAALPGVVWSAEAQEAQPTNDPPAVETLRLFPRNAPGEQGDVGPEKAVRKGGVTRISNVSEPTLTVYHPKPEKATGAACIVCPGGGYQILAWDKEGTEVAAWLNEIGITAAVLKYRVPRRAGRPKHLAPLQDAQRAIRTVRHHARQWNIDSERIGIMGFSAGGHLSAAASTNFDQPTYEPIDPIDEASARPNFAMLIYPAYLAEDDQAEHLRLAAELKVTAQTPPTIILGTADDRYMRGVPAYYRALVRHKVPIALHVYPKGGHGYGLRPSERTVSTWPRRCEDWLAAGGLLKRK